MRPLNIIAFYSFIITVVAVASVLMYSRERSRRKREAAESARRINEFKKGLEKEIKQRIAEVNKTNKDLYQANIMLNQEKDKSNAIIKYMGDGIIVIDNDNLVIAINELALEALDSTDACLIYKPVSSVIKYTQYLNALRKVQNNESTHVELELPLTKDSRSHKILNFRITKAIDKKGNPIGVINVIRDITKQKELDHLKNNFIRTISHELRTPLTSIIGFLELLKNGKRGPLNAEQQEYLDVILKGSQHLRQLINDLLDVSLIESRKIQLKLEEVNLISVYRELTDSFKPQTTMKNVSLEFIENLSVPTVITDEEKARRIFINLLSNAVKFTEKGYVKVYFRVEDAMVITYIEDSGIGLSPAEKETIFEKFRQLDTSSTRKYEGLGIGLSIVRDLLSLLGGHIDVVSEEGKGSTFFFSLPLQKITKDAAQ